MPGRKVYFQHTMEMYMEIRWYEMLKKMSDHNMSYEEYEDVCKRNSE